MLAAVANVVSALVAPTVVAAAASLTAAAPVTAAAFVAVGMI